ncbi:hypothetical protein HPB49_024120 [Dermacentor silvarum]|uniref:Uncharacterized protein n=1 Tax=Dermacentor silvarum TaxID=543639 RepID=A0ACB8DH23_DERSI|nr:hypothetical protein HPB49_024120 [Dermacentor silvarum]
MDNMEIQVEGEDIPPENVTEHNGWKTARDRREPDTSTPKTAEVDLHPPYGGGTANTREQPRNMKQRILRASKMPHLPKADTTIVVRPRGGLNLAKVGGPAVTAAIFHATCIAKEEQALDTICTNNHQNIIVISTPNEANIDKVAHARSEIKVMFTEIQKTVSSTLTAVAGLTDRVIHIEEVVGLTPPPQGHLGPHSNSDILMDELPQTNKAGSPKAKSLTQDGSKP